MLEVLEDTLIDSIKLLIRARVPIIKMKDNKRYIYIYIYIYIHLILIINFFKYYLSVASLVI